MADKNNNERLYETNARYSFIGVRLSRDAEVKETKKGEKYVSLSFPHSDGFNPQVSWVSVKVFAKSEESLNRLAQAKKSDVLSGSGRMSTWAGEPKEAGGKPVVNISLMCNPGDISISAPITYNKE